MTTSDKIRKLASEGVRTAEIARILGIRYQHAYNVLKASSPSVRATLERIAITPKEPASKIPLTIDLLKSGGFFPSGQWIVSPDGRPVLDRPAPKEPGVYAFVVRDIAQYVGVATMGLARRLYFYGKPGVTQRTSLRLHQILREELLIGGAVDVYIATPPDLDWNGLPVNGAAGLELGLIKRFSLPWNMRSAR